MLCASVHPTPTCWHNTYVRTCALPCEYVRTRGLCVRRNRSRSIQLSLTVSTRIQGTPDAGWGEHLLQANAISRVRRPFFWLEVVANLDSYLTTLLVLLPLLLFPLQSSRLLRCLDRIKIIFPTLATDPFSLLVNFFSEKSRLPLSALTTVQLLRQRFLYSLERNSIHSIWIVFQNNAMFFKFFVCVLKWYKCMTFLMWEEVGTNIFVLFYQNVYWKQT